MASSERGARNLEALKDVHQLAPAPRVKADEGLVEQDEARAHRQDPGERHAACLAARETVGMPLAESRLREAHEVEGRRDGGGHLRLGPAQAAWAEGNVLACRRGEELHLGSLEHKADLALSLGVSGGTWLDSVEHDGASLRCIESADDLQERGLARARGADQRHRSAPRQVERHVSERRDSRSSLVVAEVDAPGRPELAPGVLADPSPANAGGGELTATS